MKMTKHNICLFMLHEFKLGQNASETSANIDRAWGDGSTRDRTIIRCFQKFPSSDYSLKDEKNRRRLGTLDNKHLQAVVE